MSNRHKIRHRHLQMGKEVSAAIKSRALVARKAQTFHLEIIGLGNVQQVITLGYLKIVLLTVLVNERDVDPTKKESILV